MKVEWSAPELSSLALAYIGDAVWEVYARNHVLNKGIRRPGELHRATTRYVRASAQAKLADAISEQLTEVEQDVLRRGRNAKSLHIRKHADVLDYRHSTGFEAVIGYLYGTGQLERLEEICAYALAWIDQWKDDNRAKNK